MKRVAAFAGALLLAVAAASSSEPPRPLVKAPVLPLALDDAFQFRKTKLFLNDPKIFKPAADPMIRFERARANFGAITNSDQIERRGHYFTFFWRADRPADLTLRLEYRQENLGSYVQAREQKFADVKGNRQTDFSITGDDYVEDGRIVAWRALLIENGRIVALTQSFLWN